MDNSVLDQLKEVEKRIDYPEQRLGKELAEPFPAAVSGGRKLLYASQAEQAMSLVRPEVPFIQTGYEGIFHSVSPILSEISSGVIRQKR